MQIMDAVHATEADATSLETFDEAFESPNREGNETMVQCAMRVRASVERVREMEISTGRQLEGYLILKKVVLDKSEVLTMTSLTGGNYDAEKSNGPLEEDPGKRTCSYTFHDGGLGSS